MIVGNALWSSIFGIILAAEKGNEGVIVYADSTDELIKLIAGLDFSDRIITAFDIFLLNE